MRTVLVCVRTPLAAQTVASTAARLGMTGVVRTAVSETEAMIRLAERPAEVVLADTAVTRPDSVGFTRRVLARAPQAQVVLFGAEDPRVAAAAVAAGARGVIRGVEHDLVSVVAKALLLLLLPVRPQGMPINGANAQPAAVGGGGPQQQLGRRPRPAPGRAGVAGTPNAAGMPAHVANSPMVPSQRGDGPETHRPGHRPADGVARQRERPGCRGRAGRPPAHPHRAGAPGVAGNGRRQEQRRDRTGIVRLARTRSRPTRGGCSASWVPATGPTPWPPGSARAS